MRNRMRRFLAAGVLACLLASLTGCGGSDEAKIEGIWDPLDATRGGVSTDKRWNGFVSVEFFKDYIIVDIRGQKFYAKYSIDPSKSPRHIDITESDQTLKGIYELGEDGKTLNLCLAGDGVDRPTEFDLTDSNDHLVVKLKRRAPHKPAK